MKTRIIIILFLIVLIVLGFVFWQRYKFLRTKEITIEINKTESIQNKIDSKLKILSDGQVTNTINAKSIISWSPDSTKFLFREDLPSEGRPIPYILNLYDIEKKTITKSFGPETSYDFNKWFKDNKGIGFVKYSEGGEVPTVIDVDGTNYREISTGYKYIEFSPSGDKLVQVDENNNIKFRNLATSGTIYLGNKNLSWPAWSPDDQYIAFTDWSSNEGWGASIVILKNDAKDLSELKTIGITSMVGTEGFDPKLQWSSDSKYILEPFYHNVYSLDGKIMRTGQEEWRCRSATFSPDNKRILIYQWIQDKNVPGDRKGDMWVGKDCLGDEVTYPISESDWRHLDVKILIQDIGSPEIKELFHGGFDTASRTPGWAWTPDGQGIIYNFENNLFIINHDGSGLRKISETEKEYISPSISPDGKYLLYVDKNNINMIVLGHQ